MANSSVHEDPREAPPRLQSSHVSAQTDTPSPQERRLARKSRRHENRRQLLLDHARELLHAHGPLAFTMEQLATAADTSKASLYYYFRAKEDVIAALAVEALGREVAQVSRAVVRATTGIDAALALLRTRVEHFLSEPDDFRVLYQWAPVLGQAQRLSLAEVYPLSAVIYTTLEAKLQRDSKLGLLHPDTDPRTFAELAWMTAHGLLTMALGHPDPGPKTAAQARWRSLCDAACMHLRRAATVGEA